MNRRDAEEALMTREQRYRAQKRDRMYVSRTMLLSPAFRALKTPASYAVLFAFFERCSCKNLQTRPGCRDKSWVITNNGRIVFPYNEARDRFGISTNKFTRAIDDLIRISRMNFTISFAIMPAAQPLSFMPDV